MSEVQRQSRFERGNDVVVMKFGGTSVQDEAAIRRLIAIVRGTSCWKPGKRLSAAISARRSRQCATSMFGTNISPTNC